VTAELLATSHEVVGLARSDASARAIADAGAQVRRGDVTDLDSLRAGAGDADGIVHTAFNHDFSRHIGAAEADFAAVEFFGSLLEGTGRPLVIASGLVGGPAVETDRPDPASSPTPRLRTEQLLHDIAEAIGRRATSTITRELLGWEPVHPGLIEDLEAGHYFRAA